MFIPVHFLEKKSYFISIYSILNKNMVQCKKINKFLIHLDLARVLYIKFLMLVLFPYLFFNLIIYFKILLNCKYMLNVLLNVYMSHNNAWKNGYQIPSLNLK